MTICRRLRAPRGTWRGRFVILPGLFASLLSGCAGPKLNPDPHYVLGAPYRAGAVWYYPRDTYDLDATGLAGVAKGDASRLTANGEVFDQTALAAAHPTVQLPAIARLTNLENGREVTVRLNDRGTGDPHRLVEVTRRTAALLAIPADGVARVRLRIQPSESHAAADALPGAPSLAMSAAPRGTVEVADLAPPPGIRQGDGRALPDVAAARPAETAVAAPPMRLPETVTQTEPKPGRLFVRLDTFDVYQYAAVQRARMDGEGARIVSILDGRSHRFRVEVGPLADVARAEAVQDRALASGIPDAQIIVD